MTSDRDIAFVWPDAWLLYAILGASEHSGSTSLKGVIAIGDHLNHAIFMLDELNGGMDRLQRVGLVRYGDARFLPTARATQLYINAREGAQEVHQVTDRLLAALRGLDSVQGSGMITRPSSSLAITQAELEEAAAAYHEEFRAALKKSREQDQ